MRIALIEHEPGVARLLHLFLTLEQKNMVTLYKSYEAFACSQDCFDLVVLNPYIPPAASGILHAFLKHCPNTPLLVITVHDEVVTLARAWRLPVLLMPFTRSTLLSMIAGLGVGDSADA